MSSNIQRLKQAMLILQGSGTIQERLASAYRTAIQYVGPEGFDENMIYILEKINDELTKLDAEGDKDNIDMSAESLSRFEAQALADNIRELYEYCAKQEAAVT